MRTRIGAARAALDMLRIDVPVVSDAEEPIDPGSIEDEALESEDESLVSIPSAGVDEAGEGTACTLDELFVHFPDSSQQHRMKRLCSHVILLIPGADVQHAGAPSQDGTASQEIFVVSLAAHMQMQV